MKRSLALVLMAAVLLAVAGCSDESQDSSGSDQTETTAGSQNEESGDSATGTEALDVCSMLTDSDVQEVLGEPAEPVDQSTGEMYGCSWTGTGDALNVLSVSVMVHPDPATAQEMYEATKEGLEGTEITGLGDDASYSESFGLEVLYGRYDISVDNTGPDEKQSDITVAQTVMEQLT